MPSLDASVKPVLYAIFSPSKHALWTMVCQLGRCKYLDRQFNVDQGYLAILPWLRFASKYWADVKASILPLSFGCTDAEASVKPVLLNLLFCSWIDLDLISSSIVSSSKWCIDFFWRSWAVFERVCKISKVNSILVTLETRKILNLRKWVLDTHDCFELRGFLLY